MGGPLRGALKISERPRACAESTQKAPTHLVFIYYCFGLFFMFEFSGKRRCLHMFELNKKVF
jgi:hypothetical protein